MASFMFASTSRREAPVDTHPGRSGEYAENPVSVTSMTIEYRFTSFLFNFAVAIPGARASCPRTSCGRSIPELRAYCFSCIRYQIENDGTRAARISRRGQDALAPVIGGSCRERGQTAFGRSAAARGTGSASATPPQGGSNRTVRLARAFFPRVWMRLSKTGMFPDCGRRNSACLTSDALRRSPGSA